MRLCNIILIGLLAALSAGHLNAQDWTQCNNSASTDRGTFYTHWTDTNDACMDMYSSYGYGYDYNTSGNVVGGKGWSTGASTRKIGYNCAEFTKRGSQTQGKLWLTAYGWMERTNIPWNSKDRRIEYYVIDNWKGEWPLNNAGAWAVGSQYTVAGEGTYQAYQAYRYNKPNAYGADRDFVQYFSIRTSKRPLRWSNGALRNHTISMREHFKAWNERCLVMGTTNRYMVMAIEGLNTSAKTRVGVWGAGWSSSSWLGNACTKSGQEPDTGKPPAGLNPEAPGGFAPVAFPNPTSGQVLIDGLEEEPAVLKVFNAIGQQVELQQVIAVGGRTELDFSQRKPGAYLIQVTQGKQQQVLRILRK